MAAGSGAARAGAAAGAGAEAAAAAGAGAGARPGLPGAPGRPVIPESSALAAAAGAAGACRAVWPTKPSASPSSSATRKRAASDVAKRVVHTSRGANPTGAGTSLNANERGKSSSGRPRSRLEVARRLSSSLTHSSQPARCSSTRTASDGVTSPSI